MVRQSILPWTLFGLVLMAGFGGYLVEAQKRDALQSRAAATARSEERARAELATATEANRALDTRVQELQNELRKVNAKAVAARIEPVKAEKPSKKMTKKARRKHGKRHR